MQPPELEVLDQLQGCDEPLSLMASLFPDESYAKRAIGAMIRAGDIVVMDANGRVVPEWRWNEIERDPAAWAAAAKYRLSLTDAGANRIS